MKKYLIFLILFTVFSACNLFKKGIEIKGIINDGAGEYIYLIDITPASSKPDSVLIDSDNRFNFFHETTEPKDYILYTSRDNFIRIVAQPFEKIELEAQYDNLTKSYKIISSETNKQITNLNQHLNNSFEVLDSLNSVYNKMKDSTGFDTILIKLTERSKQIYQNEHQFLTNFIKSNPSSLASYVALAQKLNPNFPILNPQTDFEYFNMVDSAFLQLYPGSSISNQLHSFVVKIQNQIKTQNEKSNILGLGVEAPEIILQNPEGKEIILSDYRGKYVLLDFWAAWCTPCRKESPVLVRMYRKYKWKGFEIFQVSLDKEKEAWIKAIKDDKLNWTHVSDLQYWNSPIAKQYMVESIPANFLLDKEGKIIAKNLRGEKLEAKLKELFAK